MIDPQRDIDRVLEVLAADGVRLTHVFETHIHNDYVTGGLALARETGATYLVNAADEVSFERTPISDDEIVEVGARMRVRASRHARAHLHPPLLRPQRDARHRRRAPVGVFTGGSLLYGATGRPDLLGAEHTDTLVATSIAGAQRLAAELPDEAGGLPHPWVRVVLLGHASPRPPLDHRAGEEHPRRCSPDEE